MGYFWPVFCQFSLFLVITSEPTTESTPEGGSSEPTQSTHSTPQHHSTHHTFRPTHTTERTTKHTTKHTTPRTTLPFNGGTTGALPTNHKGKTEKKHEPSSKTWQGFWGQNRVVFCPDTMNDVATILWSYDSFRFFSCHFKSWNVVALALSRFFSLRARLWAKMMRRMKSELVPTEKYSVYFYGYIMLAHSHTCTFFRKIVYSNLISCWKKNYGRGALLMAKQAGYIDLSRHFTEQKLE